MLEEQVENRRWYIIHAYSGQEDRVKKNLEQRIQTMDVKDKIFQVIVPTEEEMERWEAFERAEVYMVT